MQEGPLHIHWHFYSSFTIVGRICDYILGKSDLGLESRSLFPKIYSVLEPPSVLENKL